MVFVADLTEFRFLTSLVIEWVIREREQITSVVVCVMSQQQAACRRENKPEGPKGFSCATVKKTDVFACLREQLLLRRQASNQR